MRLFIRHARLISLLLAAQACTAMGTEPLPILTADSLNTIFYYGLQV